MTEKMSFQDQVVRLLAEREEAEKKQAAEIKALEAYHNKLKNEGPPAALHFYDELKNAISSEVASFGDMLVLKQPKTFGSKSLELVIDGNKLLAIDLKERQLIIATYTWPYKAERAFIPRAKAGTAEIGDIGENANAYTIFELELNGEMWRWGITDKKISPKHVGSWNEYFKDKKVSKLTPDEMKQVILELIITIMRSK